MKSWMPVFTLLLIVPMLLISCGSDEPGEAGSGESAAEQEHAEFISGLSGAELAYLDELGSVIAFGSSESELSYEVQDDGSIIGFDYHYARAFAEALGKEARFVLVQSIPEFFMKDGVFDAAVITDTSIRYTPDLFDQVQILASPFAINEWRQRLMTMIPLFPVGVVLIGKDAGEITSFDQLDGTSIAVRAGDFQIPFLNDISATYDIDIEMRIYEETEDVFSLVRDDFADYTIDGSIFLAQGMQELEDLEASPLTLSLIPVGWGIASENGAMASIFEKFVSYSLEEGLLGEIWTEQMGVDFDFYLNLVGSN
jgi:ABC-type amino acid transport substrate-binding protein